MSSDVAAGTAAESTAADWDQRLEMLRSTPYIALSEEPVQSCESGVVVHDPDRTCEGYFLYNTRSSGEVLLLNTHGQVVHRWTYSPSREGDSPIETQFGDYALLMQNGDVVILSKFLDLLRVDWNSKLLWKKRLYPHHDVASAPDGTFLLIVRENKMYRGLKVNFPAILSLTADGEVIDRWSAAERLEEMLQMFDSRSFLDTYLDSVHAYSQLNGAIRGSIEAARLSRHHYYDYFHMNTVNVIPDNEAGSRDARFGEGNLLVCLRNINQIAVMEKGTYGILWTWGEEELEWPHHPTMLENGHILVFDNGTRRGYSRVLELDPITEEITWQYLGDPPESFFSKSRGSAQRLPNGNTLICESNKGRAFQVTPEGEVVWRWLNPNTHRTVRGKTHRETVYRMIYHPPEQVQPLLARWWWLE